MEALAFSCLSARELRAVIFIMNQTDGYIRTEDTIKPNFWQERTGIPKRHLPDVWKRLLQWNIITRKDKWRFSVNPPGTWAPSALLPGRKVPENGESPKTGRRVPENGEKMPENGENQIPSKENPLKKTPKENIASKKAPPDPRVTEVMTVLAGERGWKSPSYAAEAGAVKWMLRDYAPEDILGCWSYLKADPFWEGKALLMMSVRKQIGTWVSAGRPLTKPAAPVPRTSRIEKLPAREEFAEGKPW